MRYITTTTELYHYGTSGQKWGTRLYQDKSGRRTAAGKARYKKYYDKDWRSKAESDYGAISGELEELQKKAEDIIAKQKEKAQKIVDSAQKTFDRRQAKKLTEDQVKKLKNTVVSAATTISKAVVKFVGNLISFILSKTTRVHAQ